MTFELGQGTGPLRGIKVVEIAGIGPGPHAAMLLADLGADVIRVERPGGPVSPGPRESDLLTRGRPSVALDLKHPSAVEAVLTMAEAADALIEGMRPGTTERLGLGPADCWARNPALVYGRMTGWGQDGPLARAAGHDINYVSIAGTMDGLGQDPARPQFPSNLLGDFGGGSTYLVIGLLAALLEARSSGRGQVVDAAIVDGTAHLATMLAGMLSSGFATERRGTNLLDGGVPWYALYETSDGRHMSVGPLEAPFYAVLLDLLGVSDQAPDRDDPASWPRLRTLFTDAFASRTQAEWTAVFDGTDACVAPVLPMTEAARQPHLQARGTYVDHLGVLQPAPAPRFSRTGASLTTGPSRAGDRTRDALAAWNVPDVDALIESGAAVQT